MNPLTQTLLRIDKEFTKDDLVQIIELAAYKLDLKTISNYAKDNNMSYNGVKNHRSGVTIDNIKFIAEGIKENNLPF